MEVRRLAMRFLSQHLKTVVYGYEIDSS